jgi:hypothetical protein
MFAEPRLPNQIDMSVKYVMPDIEELDDLASLFDKLLVVVVEEQNLEQFGALNPHSHRATPQQLLVLLTYLQDVADPLQLLLEIRTTDHLHADLQLQLDTPLPNFTLVHCVPRHLHYRLQEIAHLVLVKLLEILLPQLLYVAVSH